MQSNVSMRINQLVRYLKQKNKEQLKFEYDHKGEPVWAEIE